MPENETQNTEINTTFNSVSQNSLDNDLLRDISNELKVINENQALILFELQKSDKSKISSDSISVNDIKYIGDNVSKLLDATVSANTVSQNDIMTKNLESYSLSESFLLIIVFLLLFGIVLKFFNDKHYI